MYADIALYAIILLAAVFQTVTGIGFAMIAGPVILMVVNDSIAIQINIFLNLLIALVLSPHLLKHADKNLLKRLSIGTFAGLPVGVTFYLWANVEALKFFTGIGIAFMTVILILNALISAIKLRTNMATDLFAGGITGTLSAFLAMPGPAVATYMMATGTYDKQTTRSTILLLFVISYASALMVHGLLVGINMQAVTLALKFTPATGIGIFLGILLVPHVNERVFRVIVILSLAITSISLIAASIFN